MPIYIYRVPSGRLSIFRDAYFVQGLTLCNSLDPTILNCNNIIKFKNNVKKTFFY